MACLFISTIPRPGDNLTVLLRKWLQAVGVTPGCFDNGEWMLLAQLVTHYGGVARPGDSIPDLWRKILRALGDDTCHCGDWAFNSVQRILAILNPGAFQTGDSFNNLVRKILEGVNAAPVPPIDSCCLLLETNGFDLLLETNDNCLALESCPI